MPIMEIKGIHVKIDRDLEQRHLSTMEKLIIRQTKPYYPYSFSKLRFDCSNTREVLKGTAIFCPAITNELVKVLVDFAVSHNWGEDKLTVLQKV